MGRKKGHGGGDGTERKDARAAASASPSRASADLAAGAAASGAGAAPPAGSPEVAPLHEVALVSGTAANGTPRDELLVTVHLAAVQSARSAGLGHAPRCTR